MSDKTKVTTHQPFHTYEDVPLFAVNAGVSVEDALEVAASLMLYVNQLSAADAFLDKTSESGVIQTLSEMANALMKACGHVVGKEGQGAA